MRKTPHIVDLYKHYYSDDVRDFCEAFGIPITPNELILIRDIDTVIDLVKNQPEFVKQKRIDPVHEAVMLPYPSYIFALAMGTGKTVLIGTIVATEFAMALRYPEAAFMKNALVFAPGTTIIESLREISDIPFDRILPSSLHRDFLANLKITYPQTGAPEIQVQEGSAYNVIVTNTEKISLRANVKKRSNQTELEFEEKKDQAELEANLRLQKITSFAKFRCFLGRGTPHLRQQNGQRTQTGARNGQLHQRKKRGHCRCQHHRHTLLQTADAPRGCRMV